MKDPFEGAKIIRRIPSQSTNSSTADPFEGAKVLKRISTSPQFSPLPQEDNWSDFIGKSAIKGLTSLADLPKLAIKGISNIGNPMSQFTGLPHEETADFSKNVPGAQDLRQGIENTLDVDLEPLPGDSLSKKILGQGVEFASAAGPLGAIGKGAGLMNRFKAIRDATNTGAAIGSASGGLQASGVDPLVADIGSTLLMPLAPRTLAAGKNLKLATELKLAGLTPKDIKLEAAKAAQDLNIDLPSSVLTDAKLASHADQIVSKTPYYGDKLKNKYLNVEGQVRKNLEDIYEKVGPKNSEEIQKQISKLYAKRAPTDAQILPKNTLKTIDGIEQNFKTLAPSDDEIKLFASLQKLKEGLAPANIKNIPASINALVDTKKSLNATIKWNKDEGVKNLLRRIQKSLVDDIDEYGQINKSWHKNFKEADKLYGRVAKRERLEDIFSGKSINQATDTFSYNTLSKIINTKSSAKELQRLTDKETFTKIKKLGEVSRAIAVKSKNIPNPSGTAPTNLTYGTLYALYNTPIRALGMIAGVNKATQLLTDKKFLDLAIKNAEKPTILRTFKLNKKLQDIVGFGAVDLIRATEQ